MLIFIYIYIYCFQETYGFLVHDLMSEVCVCVSNYTRSFMTCVYHMFCIVCACVSFMRAALRRLSAQKKSTR